MTELNLCPRIIDICVPRGDTNPWTFTITESDGTTVVNITGFSYVLTVDPSENPIDASNNLFVLTGAILDGPNGVVEFEMDSGEADQLPATYFFDTQQTAGGGLTTVVKGKFEFQQDISK